MDEVDEWSKRAGFPFSKLLQLVNRGKKPGVHQISLAALVVWTVT
jgi:hypothetical protein